MRQIKSFQVQVTGVGADIAKAIDDKVNPFLLTAKNAQVVTASVDAMGSYPKATIIVSYDVPDKEVLADVPVDTDGDVSDETDGAEVPETEAPPQAPTKRAYNKKSQK